MLAGNPIPECPPYRFFRNQALEEEIEALKAELVNAEAANDELNLELQELQEEQLAR